MVQMIDVDALRVDTIVVPDSQVNFYGDDSGESIVQQVQVQVNGAGAQVVVQVRGQRLPATFGGDTVTLATLFEDIAKRLRGE